MDWLKEILKKAGIEEEKVDSTIADINKELPKYFIPKDKYNEVAEAKKKLESDIAERDKQLEQLKNAAGNSEELKKQIEDLQKANKEATEEWQAKMSQMQLDFAIEKALAAAKAKNAKAVMELKRISRDYKTPVICISSFNRANYKEAVTMEAFKESGAIEYSSDILIGLQLKGTGGKDFDANEAKRKDPREIELVILKNRNGRTGGKISFDYYPLFNYFREA